MPSTPPPKLRRTELGAVHAGQPPPLERAVEDTPARANKSERDTGHSLKADRQANNLDIGRSVKEIPVDIFFEKCLPHLRPGHSVDAVIEFLEEDGTIQHGRWALFNERPATQGKTEDVIFAVIAQIANKVIEAGCVVFECKTSVQYFCNPSRTPQGHLRDSTCRPDGYFLVRAPVNEKRVHWKDILASAEFKRLKETETQNDEQILWDMNQAMRAIAERISVIAHTIVDSMMRLWRSDRSREVVSEPFDFITDCRNVIHFFLAIAFAPTGQMGQDPTIIRNPRSYDITLIDVNGKAHVYRTRKMLSMAKADAPHGRATRVWMGAPLDARGHPLRGVLVIIKDTWIECDRPLEGERYEELLRAVAGDPVLEAIMKRMLLTVVGHGRVMVNGKPDLTQVLAVPGSRYVLGTGKSQAAKTNETRAYTSRQRLSSAMVHSIAETIPEVPKHDQRVHYRIAFAGTGVSLHEIRSLKEVFGAMVDVANGLKVMHKVGYVHRDMSTGNILSVDGVTKIADLEYVKHKNDVSRHSVRTGTAYFMPVEIQQHRYLFEHRPPAGHASEPFTFVRKRKRAARNEDDPNGEQSATKVVHFRYNPLHDLESLFWIGAYFFLGRVPAICLEPKELDAEFLADFADQMELFNSVFLDHGVRHDMFVNPETFRKELVGTVHPSFCRAAHRLVDILVSLAELYEKVERSTLPQNIDFFEVALNGDIHDKVISVFSDIRDMFENEDILVERVDHPKLAIPALTFALPDSEELDDIFEVEGLEDEEDEETGDQEPEDQEAVDQEAVSEEEAESQKEGDAN